MRHLTTLGLATLLLVSACGGATTAEGGVAGEATTAVTATTAATTTTGRAAGSELGSTGTLLAYALVDEGFTEAEAECLSLRLTETFGDDGLMEILLADEMPPAFDEAVGAHALVCLTEERLDVFAGSEPEAGEVAHLRASLSCTDGAGDIRSEFSGWTPSIPWGMGDVSSVDLALEGGDLSITLRTQGTNPPTGGPGSTPFIVRMYLVTGDQAGPVAYDIELMRSDDEDDPPGPIVVTTIDGMTGDVISSTNFDDVMTGPGLITATIPVSAVEAVVADDFWTEIRTEWGPDHPIGSDDEPEWMIDSACDGPQLVTVSREQSAAGSSSTASWQPKTIEELTAAVVLVDATFERGIPDGWYEQVWMKAADATGEVTTGDGVRFTGAGGSTRSGIMIDVKETVRGHDHVVVSVSGVVLEQSLSGTGWNGREAPLAVTVTYVDVDGTRHVGLGEDPTSPTNMFYLGFTALPEDGMVNGMAVGFGEPFVYQVDLMGLDPAPAKILAVGVEGGGWAPRSGEVYEVVVAAGS